MSFRLDHLFDVVTLAVHPQYEWRELAGKVARNPITGRNMPGMYIVLKYTVHTHNYIVVTFHLVIECSTLSGDCPASLVVYGPDTYRTKSVTDLELTSPEVWTTEGMKYF